MNISRPRLRTAVLYLVLAAVAIGGCLTVYGATIVLRASPLYDYVKGRQRGWSGTTHRYDPLLGFAPIPGAGGHHVFPIGDDLPMQYDGSGFRVPVNPAIRQPERNPVVLALGCSFTYGDATAAEETFPHLAAELMGGSVRNAGVPSYGLAQMLVLARRLIPEHRPDYVLVQYSPWLVDRAQTPFAPSYHGAIATPFFTPELELHPPVFPTIVFRLSSDRYRKTERGLLDFVSFTWHVALPLLLHDDVRMTTFRVKRLAGRVPSSTGDDAAVVRHVYGEIARVAQESGARMIIVGLDNRAEPLNLPHALFPKEALVVNPHDSLVAALPVKSQECYDRRYGHWRGSPPVLVDQHPNALAHREVARVIASSVIGPRVLARSDSSPPAGRSCDS
jgi:hypothetical protein